MSETAGTALHGNGQLYWNGSMRRAFAATIAGDYDYYLWMNDDTHLEDGALGVLLETDRAAARRRQGGGDRRRLDQAPGDRGTDLRGRRPALPLATLEEGAGRTGRRAAPLDTMNGNATLISREVVRRVGNIDPAFVQQMGDFDYGLRARAAGCSVWIAPGTVGTCASHAKRRPGEQPLGDELRRLWSIKELSPGPWAVYSRRWAGRLWPLYWLSPYVRHGARLALERTPLGRPRRAMT